MIFWSVLIFAFAGCETASIMGGEIKNARRSIPRALLIAGSDGDVLLHRGHDQRAGGVAGVGSRKPARIDAGRIENGRRVSDSKASFRLPRCSLRSAMLALQERISPRGARLPFVAGIDRFLPPAFGALHPRWKTPWVGLLTQFVFGALFIFLGQAGTSIKGAYDVLVSMGVITYFIPFLYLFAAMFKLQREPAGPDVIRVPGGKPVARLVAIVGFATTTFTIGLSLIPQPDEPNKLLAVIKIVGLSGLLVLIGAWIYWAGKKRALALFVAPASRRLSGGRLARPSGRHGGRHC